MTGYVTWGTARKAGCLTVTPAKAGVSGRDRAELVLRCQPEFILSDAEGLA